MDIKKNVFIFLLFIVFIALNFIRCGEAGEEFLYSDAGSYKDRGTSYYTDGSEVGASYEYDYGYYDYGGYSKDTGYKDTGYVEPEKPNPYAAVPPITSERYLFLLNPSNNSVAVIEPETLKVFSVKLDFSPKNLIVIPNTDYSIILADKASRVAMLSITSQGAEILSFPLGQKYNDISVSPDGKYIIAFYNEMLRQNNEIYEGEGRINLIKTEDLKNLKSNPSTKVYKEIDVGRRITNIFYSSERNTAYIVSKERVYLLRFDDPYNEQGQPDYIDIDSEFTENISNRLAFSVQNSDYIILRFKTGQSILVVSTRDFKSYKLSFNETITDMKFTKDMNRLIISFRDIGKVKVIPIPEGILDNTQIKEIDLGDFLAGSVEICENQFFKKALLYTNVYYREEIILLDLEDYSFEKIDHKYELDKAIDYILCAPDGLNAIIIHKKGTDENETDPTEIAVNNQEGFSVFGIKRKNINTQLLLTTKPKTISFLDNSSYAMVTATNTSTNEYRAYMVDLTKSIVNDESIQFYSDIVYAGSIPQKNIFYVLQKHSVGRISFIFMPEGTMKTITGFELNSLIE